MRVDSAGVFRSTRRYTGRVDPEMRRPAASNRPPPHPWQGLRSMAPDATSAHLPECPGPGSAAARGSRAFQMPVTLTRAGASSGRPGLHSARADCSLGPARARARPWARGPGSPLAERERESARARERRVVAPNILPRHPASIKELRPLSRPAIVVGDVVTM
jgi:hypothetical protein